MDGASSGSGKMGEQQALRWRAVLRRAGIGVLGAVVLLVVVFFLLPVWISNEQGRAYVLGRINRRLADAAAARGMTGDAAAVRVAVDDWSVGWFRTTELNNLRVTLADGTMVVSCPKVRTGMSLWDVLWGNYDLGNTSADGLQLVVVKYADGRSSLDALAAGLADLMRSVRGGMQINGGEATVTSERAGETVKYVDIKVTLTIASPEAPFHLQASAVRSGDAWVGDVTVNATLPALKVLGSGGGTGGANVWSLLGDLDFSATNVPAGVLCDCLGLNAGWEESLGQVLEVVRFTNRGSAMMDAGRPMLFVRGSGARAGGGGKDETSIDARMLLRAPDAAGHGGLLSVMTGRNAGEEFHLEAALRMSPKLAGLLGRVNPVLGEAQGTAEGGLVRVSVQSLNVPLGLDGMAGADGMGRVTFPGMVFNVGGRGVIGQLKGMAGLTGEKIAGSAGPLRVQLSGGKFSYENFVVELGGGGGTQGVAVNFSGTVGLNGAVDLTAGIPVTGGGLSSGRMQVVIGGTVDGPVVRRAE